MAAPATANVHELTGVWTMDTKDSDSLDPMLKIQGFSWLMRKTLLLATIEVVMTHIHELSAPDKIKVAQIIKPGKFETVEDCHTVNGVPRKTNAGLLGNVAASMKYISTNEIEDEELRTKVKAGAPEGDEGIEDVLINTEKGWEMRGIWTFEVREGKRWLVRRTLVKGKGERYILKTFYDYLREVEAK